MAQIDVWRRLRKSQAETQLTGWLASNDNQPVTQLSACYCFPNTHLYGRKTRANTLICSNIVFLQKNLNVNECRWLRWAYTTRNTNVFLGGTCQYWRWWLDWGKWPVLSTQLFHLDKGNDTSFLRFIHRLLQFVLLWHLLLHFTLLFTHLHLLLQIFRQLHSLMPWPDPPDSSRAASLSEMTSSGTSSGPMNLAAQVASAVFLYRPSSLPWIWWRR